MAKIKTKSELLKAYKKANKDRREIIANRAGFNSGDEYKAHLSNQIEVEVSTDKDDELVVHNVHILDASTSMGGSRMRAALTGINSEIAELKKDTSVKYLQTVVSFGYSRDYKVIHDKQPILEVGEVYVKSNGMTALYDAIGKTLETIISNRKPNEKTIVKVFTDGGENSSLSEYKNPEVLNEFIKQCEKRDVTVAFVGTGYDVENIIRRLGIDRSNTLSHDNTQESISQVFATTATATKDYVGKSLRGEDTLKGFYKQAGTL